MAITRIEDKEGRDLKINNDGSINATVSGLSGNINVKSNPFLRTIETWEGSSNITKVVPTSESICIANDGTTDLVVRINALSFTVKPSEVFEEVFSPFTSVTIQATGPYRALTKADI